MEITQIVVTIHEKRNHPHEFGHYDASVALTAESQTFPTFIDDPINRLREIARRHVEEECDGWIAGIEESRRLSELQGNIASFIANLRWAGDDLLHAVKHDMRNIQKLPEELQPHWRAKLLTAWKKEAARREEAERDQQEEPPF